MPPRNIHHGSVSCGGEEVWARRGGDGVTTPEPEGAKAIVPPRPDRLAHLTAQSDGYLPGPMHMSLITLLNSRGLTGTGSELTPSRVSLNMGSRATPPATTATPAATCTQPLCAPFVLSLSPPPDLWLLEFAEPDRARCETPFRGRTRCMDRTESRSVAVRTTLRDMLASIAQEELSPLPSSSFHKRRTGYGP